MELQGLKTIPTTIVHLFKSVRIPDIVEVTLIKWHFRSQCGILREFFVTQILREINFAKCELSSLKKCPNHKFGGPEFWQDGYKFHLTFEWQIFFSIFHTLYTLLQPPLTYILGQQCKYCQPKMIPTFV